MSANQIHPSAFVGDGVRMGSGNVIMPFAVIIGPVEIGDNNWIGSHTSIGTPPQHRAWEHPSFDQPQGEHGVVIGSRNLIRESVTIHQGTMRPTRIGNDVFLLAYSHVPHDADYEDDVTLANSVQVGGHTWIGRGSTIGLGVEIHQRTSIGAYAMVGMNSTVTRDIPPFALAVGTPARIRGANRDGLERSGAAGEADIERIDEHYRSGVDGVPPGLDGELGAFADQFRAHAEQAKQRSGGR